MLYFKQDLLSISLFNVLAFEKFFGIIISSANKTVLGKIKKYLNLKLQSKVLIKNYRL